MPYQTLLVERADAVATITLNRPDAYNALNLALGRDLFDAVLEVDDDPEVRCVRHHGRWQGVLRRWRRKGLCS